MTDSELKKVRLEAGYTQAHLARRLGVTQAYLSLLENGKRRIPDGLQRRVAAILHLPPTALPMSVTGTLDPRATDELVEQGLVQLGYPGFAYRKTRGKRRNPGDLLLLALARDDLDPRLAEALPWLLLSFQGFDHDELHALAKSMDLQNRLGFTVSLARGVAERDPSLASRLKELGELERKLERSRLAREDTYAQERLSERMRRWLLENRSLEAEHWNLLTDVKLEHLPYAKRSQGTVAELPS
jgi:transcriptional regulator with XRE-family HTH domain